MVSVILELGIEDRRGKGRPKVTWEHVVRTDMAMRIRNDEALFGDRWAAIRRPNAVTLRAY